MVIPIESINGFIAFCVFFLCVIWLHCSYVRGGRQNLNMKSFFTFFLLMSMHEFFAVVGILLLASNPKEVAESFYNAAFVISNFMLFFAYSELIAAALGTYFEAMDVGLAKKYYRSVIAAFGLIIIIASAVYQARPVFDNETYLINANYNPFVQKMMVAILLISMVPASLLFFGKIFFIKENFRGYAIMGMGIMISVAGKLISENVQGVANHILTDMMTILGFVALFYGMNMTGANKNIRTNLVNVKSYE